MNQPTLSLDPNTDDKLKLIQIEYGAYNTVGLSKIGEVFMGDNDHGQLGHGDQKDRKVESSHESRMS